MAELMVNDAGATAGTVDPQGETGRAGPVVLERDRRLSESVLWKIQREYFDRRGIAVWSKGDVPHYITNNPFIARAYARLVLAWLRDWQAAPGGAPSVPLDPSQPVYCVELGSGAGRFAYQFLKQFGTLHARSVLKDLPFKYVMTAFTERNIRHRQDHPFLRSYVDSGRLDFARFDAERDTEIKLEISGTVLRPGAVKNPLAVMANSVFDSLPQDLFAVTGGQLHEGLVTTTNTGTVLD